MKQRTAAESTFLNEEAIVRNYRRIENEKGNKEVKGATMHPGFCEHNDILLYGVKGCGFPARSFTNWDFSHKFSFYQIFLKN